MPSAYKTFFRKIANWLFALRSITRTAREVQRLGGEVAPLNEKFLFLHVEYNRLCELYDSVTARTAILEKAVEKKTVNEGILVEIAPGELIDKITILEIKLEKISDPAKLANIRHEYEILTAVFRSHLTETSQVATLTRDLKDTNLQIWRIEDDIRDHERDGNFGENFVKLARSVYRTNDKRAELKRRINDLMNSKIVEEKSYSAY
jgi:hypothetical protein